MLKRLLCLPGRPFATLEVRAKNLMMRERIISFIATTWYNSKLMTSNLINLKLDELKLDKPQTWYTSNILQLTLNKTQTWHTSNLIHLDLDTLQTRYTSNLIHLKLDPAQNSSTGFVRHMHNMHCISPIPYMCQLLISLSVTEHENAEKRSLGSLPKPQKIVKACKLLQYPLTTILFLQNETTTKFKHGIWNDYLLRMSNV